MTDQAKQAIKENLKPFRVNIYNGIIHPLLEAGRKYKHIAYLKCAWCGKILKANYKTSNGLDSSGICSECGDRLISKSK